MWSRSCRQDTRPERAKGNSRRYGAHGRTLRTHVVVQASDPFFGTSCRMCLSRLRSVTSRFSCRFSSSSCFNRPSRRHRNRRTFFFKRWNVCSEIPIRRMTSATGVPVSPCFSANAICSSVYLNLFIPATCPKASQDRKALAQNGLKTAGTSWGRHFTSFQEAVIRHLSVPLFILARKHSCRHGLPAFQVPKQTMRKCALTLPPATPSAPIPKLRLPA